MFIYKFKFNSIINNIFKTPVYLYKYNCSKVFIGYSFLPAVLPDSAIIYSQFINGAIEIDISFARV